jgi:hypothetical protein
MCCQHFVSVLQEPFTDDPTCGNSAAVTTNRASQVYTHRPSRSADHYCWSKRGTITFAQTSRSHGNGVSADRF